MFLEAGADSNIVNRIGTTPLALAIHSFDALNMVKLLLSYGANPIAKTPLSPESLGGGCSPLETCALSVHHDSSENLEVIIDAARNKGEAYQWSIDRALLALATQKSPLLSTSEKAKILLAAGANPLAKDWDGQTALSWAKNKRNLALTLVFERHLAERSVSTSTHQPKT